MSKVCAAPDLQGITCQVIAGSPMKSHGLSVGVDGVGKDTRMFVSLSNAEGTWVAVLDGPRFAAMSQIWLEAGEKAIRCSQERAQ